MDHYNEYCDLYSLAEKNIKQVETLIDQLPIPPVNELRYAGYHCACSLRDGTSPKDKEEHIDSAKKHCKRAIYDAMEIGILYYLRTVKDFHDDYQLINISPVIPDYIKHVRKIEEITKFVSDNNRHDFDRHSLWDKAQEHFDAIWKISKTLDDGRIELNKILYRWKMGFLIGVYGLIIAMIGVIVALLK